MIETFIVWAFGPTIAVILAIIILILLGIAGIALIVSLVHYCTYRFWPWSENAAQRRAELDK